MFKKLLVDSLKITTMLAATLITLGVVFGIAYGISLVVQYIPVWVTLPVVGGLVVALVTHGHYFSYIDSVHTEVWYGNFYSIETVSTAIKSVKPRFLYSLGDALLGLIGVLPIVGFVVAVAMCVVYALLLQGLLAFAGGLILGPLIFLLTSELRKKLRAQLVTKIIAECVKLG